MGIEEIGTFEAELEDAVRTIVGDHLGVPGLTVSLDTPIDDELGADWLDRLELIMTVEELFDLQFSEEDINTIHKVQDFVTILLKMVPHKQGRFNMTSQI